MGAGGAGTSQPSRDHQHRAGVGQDLWSRLISRPLTPRRPCEARTSRSWPGGRVDDLAVRLAADHVGRGRYAEGGSLVGGGLQGAVGLARPFFKTFAHVGEQPGGGEERSGSSTVRMLALAPAVWQSRPWSMARRKAVNRRWAQQVLERTGPVAVGDRVRQSPSAPSRRLWTGAAQVLPARWRRVPYVPAAAWPRGWANSSGTHAGVPGPHRLGRHRFALVDALAGHPAPMPGTPPMPTVCRGGCGSGCRHRGSSGGRRTHWNSGRGSGGGGPPLRPLPQWRSPRSFGSSCAPAGVPGRGPAVGSWGGGSTTRSAAAAWAGMGPGAHGSAVRLGITRSPVRPAVQGGQQRASRNWVSSVDPGSTGQ